MNQPDLFTPYYNTTNLEGKPLKEKKAKAATQDERVLSFMRNGKEWTACQIWKLIFTDRTPLTSVRRALNSLMKQGLVDKLDKMKVGYYGDVVHMWRVK